MPKRLHKSQTDRMIAGVCGGLAEYFDVDPVFMRLGFLLLAFLTGIGFLLYPALWIVMPEESSLDRPPREVVRENLDRMRGEAERLGEELKGTMGSSTPATGEGTEATSSVEGVTPATPSYADREPIYRHSHPSGDRQFIAGMVILLLGLLLLLQNLNLFWWASFRHLWPLVLIAVGVFMLYRQSQSRQH